LDQISEREEDAICLADLETSKTNNIENASHQNNELSIYKIQKNSKGPIGTSAPQTSFSKYQIHSQNKQNTE
jgi:hypothetical protein